MARPRRIAGACALLAWASLACGAGNAIAHPHVWASAKIEIIYDAGGSITALRHHWQFDEIFSTFAVSGLTAGNFALSSEQLEPLAKRFVGSLKAYQYFSHVTVNGEKASFDDPTIYSLRHKDGVLTLDFMLPLKRLARADTAKIEIYDSSYYVHLALADQSPVRLVDAPETCRPSIDGRKPPQSIGEALLNAPDIKDNWAAQFSSLITVNCR